MSLLKKVIFLVLLNFFLMQALVFAFNNLPEQKTKVASSGKIVPTLIPSVTSKQPTLATKENQIVETPTAAMQNTPEPTAPPDLSRCVIVIDGKKYDVTEFRKIHSGGDVFKCGTDMTADFYARHDASYLPMMEKYRLQ
ncbi:MAG: hypothetical protein M1450_00465 [Patescibacteria group bacterium]|nr:hypothetical protein [Patescibacteria group bacterium]